MYDYCKCALFVLIYFHFTEKLPSNLRPQYDLLIVGAGLSGAVIAEQASERKGLTSLVIDKRNHIGGNCYDFVDEKGIRVHSKIKKILDKDNIIGHLVTFKIKRV